MGLRLCGYCKSGDGARCADPDQCFAFKSCLALPGSPVAVATAERFRPVTQHRGGVSGKINDHCKTGNCSKEVHATLAEANNAGWREDHESPIDEHGHHNRVCPAHAKAPTAVILGQEITSHAGGTTLCPCGSPVPVLLRDAITKGWRESSGAGLRWRVCAECADHTLPAFEQKCSQCMIVGYVSMGCAKGRCPGWRTHILQLLAGARPTRAASPVAAAEGRWGPITDQSNQPGPTGCSCGVQYPSYCWGSHIMAAADANRANARTQLYADGWREERETKKRCCPKCVEGAQAHAVSAPVRKCLACGINEPLVACNIGLCLGCSQEQRTRRGLHPSQLSTVAKLTEGVIAQIVAPNEYEPGFGKEADEEP